MNCVALFLELQSRALEQYYIVWPLLITVLVRGSTSSNRNTRNVVISLSLLSAASYATSVYASPAFGFFMLPTRFFEFGVGGLASLLESYCPSRVFLQEIASASGICIIGFSFALLPPAAPTHLSLPAVLGTVAVILSTQSRLNQTLFGNCVASLFGSLTYAWYLSHWPILVFAQYISNGLEGASSLLNPLFLFLISMVVAWLLNYYIENPMRYGKGKYTMALVALFCVSVSVCCAGIVTKGWRNSHLDDTKRTFRTSRRNDVIDSRNMCHISDSTPDGLCAVGIALNESRIQATRSPSLQWRAVVVGSSFARHLTGAFEELSRTEGNFLFRYRPGCFFETMDQVTRSCTRRRKSVQCEKKCIKWNEKTWKIVLSLPKNSTVLLANLWRTTKLESMIETYTEVSRAGMRPVVVGTTPGVHQEDAGLFACHDLRLSLKWPLSILAKHMRCPLTHRPSKVLLRGHNAILAIQEPPLQYLNVIDKYCSKSKRGQIDCKAEISETKPDRSLTLRDDTGHYTTAGSRSKAFIYKDFFAKYHR